jgi:hypothetical protein
MSHHSDSKDALIPKEPLPAGAEEFSKKVHGLLDGKAKDEATVARALDGAGDMLDVIAAGLYNMASMLVGEGEDSIRLIETAVARTETPGCGDPQQGRMNSRRALCTAAIELIAERNPPSLAVPEWLQHATTCIDDDDLESAGISREDLEHMLTGSNRENVKNWIESLPTATRVVFVLRAVAGFTADETAKMLTEHGGKAAEGWSAEMVREIFRQGLCSLASQLIQATTK